MVTKDIILSEIKRLADENGGKPPGSKKFEAETGIKQFDWFGKHWARWNEALVEAGFAPNQLQEAYDPEYILKTYALLARDLGRLPTRGDLRLRARNTPSFPSSSTFDKKMGAKAEFVKQLLSFCERESEFEDVAEMCRKYIQHKRQPSNKCDSQEECGFVYLIKSGRFFKIGRSNSTGRREYELAIQLPEKAKKIHEIRTDDPSGIEAYWHRRFEVKRKNGEWFELDASDINAFKRRKFM